MLFRYSRLCVCIWNAAFFARGLQNQISELRVRYIGATPLSAVELLHSALERRSAEKERLKEELKRANEQLEALTVEHEQETVRREMSLELQNALESVQGENDYRQTLDSWAARNIQLRLQVGQTTPTVHTHNFLKYISNSHASMRLSSLKTYNFGRKKQFLSLHIFFYFFSDAELIYHRGNY